MSTNNTIYYLTHNDIKDENILKNHIYKDLDTNYYYSDDFSCEFYIHLAKSGFISTTTEYGDDLYLLPELQFEYALLDFEDLHISKKVKKLINKKDYIFTINQKLDELLIKLDEYHKPNWLIGEYKELIKRLNKYKSNHIDFEILTFEISDINTNELVAAEIGYKINNTYTSLTGFSSKEKKYNNYGKLQLILLAKYLEENNYHFWNLGHPYMQYKFDIGAKMYKRDEFLNRWERSIN